MQAEAPQERITGPSGASGGGTHSASDMIATGNVQLIATIPDSISASTSAGTCLMTRLPVYRFVNVNTGEHFFTISESEKNDVLQNKPWFRSEGGGFSAHPTQQPGTLPVYRFVDTTGHFYTIYESEKNGVLQNYKAFTYEGIAFFAYPTQQAAIPTSPIYRFQDTISGERFFTIYEREKDAVTDGYNWYVYEVVGFYAYHRETSK